MSLQHMAERVVTLAEQRWEKEYQHAKHRRADGPSLEWIVYLLYPVLKGQCRPKKIQGYESTEQSQQYVVRNVAHGERIHRTGKRYLAAQKKIGHSRRGH